MVKMSYPPDPPRNAGRPRDHLIKIDAHRPEIAMLNRILEEKPATDPETLTLSMLREGCPSFSDEEIKLLRAQFFKRRGAALFARGDHPAAREEYMRGIREIMGPSFESPIPYVGEQYLGQSYTLFLDMVALANNMALTYIREGNTPDALYWLEEVDLLYYFQRRTQRPMDHEWMVLDLNMVEYYIFGVKAKVRRAEIFKRLYNTGQESIVRLKAAALGYIEDMFFPVPEITSLNRSHQEDYARLLTLRHPDVSLANVLHTITEPILQIRGSWQKRSTKNKIASRHGACVSVWNSRLYVLSGDNGLSSDFYFDDFQYLDLSLEPFGKWQRLPSLPKPSQWRDPRPFVQKCDRWNAVIHEDVLWYFNGSKQMAKFDLVKEKWTLVSTSLPDATWPYVDKCESFALEAHKGVIYIFGGSDERYYIGNDILMSLDIKTLRWKILSGTAEPAVKKSTPPLRTHPQSWLDHETEKLYILYGGAERSSGPPGLRDIQDFAYSDMWRFDIPTSTWRQERLHGNPPCPRVEFASTHNTVLNKVFVYGGYHPSLNSGMRPGRNFNFTYFGDTFMWTPETNTWSQVMTRGFPTHRAQSSLVTDPATGCMYLFGGYSNEQFTGSEEEKTRCFSDVWQLCVDLPGGQLEKVNLEEEARLAALGADRRCYGCGDLGRFKRCGGTCNGAVSFCSAECAADRWREHKAMHACRKKPEKRSGTV